VGGPGSKGKAGEGRGAMGIGSLRGGSIGRVVGGLGGMGSEGEIGGIDETGKQKRGAGIEGESSEERIWKKTAL